MKFLELHFNPQKREDIVFDTFCFSPVNSQEYSLGDLYLVGEIKNVLKNDKDFLLKIVEIFKKEYYRNSEESPQDSFKNSLQKVNEFLEEEIKKENTIWLGNINMLVMSLTPDFLMNIASVGNFKIIISRQGEIFNIGENMNISTSAGRVFSNMIEGKVAKEDKILILSKEVFDVFCEERIFERLTRVKKLREMERIFEEKKNVLREIFGICFLILVKKSRRKLYLLSFLQKHFSCFLAPCSEFISKNLSKIGEKIFPSSLFLQEKFKKSLFYILILIIISLLGCLIF